MDETPLTILPRWVDLPIKILLCALFGGCLLGALGVPGFLAAPLGVILFYRPLKDRLNGWIDRAWEH
jgi:hypothetical protein